MESRFWRTLVRADKYDNDNVYVVIPGFDPSRVIAIPKLNIPEDIVVIIEVEIDEVGVFRFHANCNIVVSNVEDIILKEPWEISSEKYF